MIINMGMLKLKKITNMVVRKIVVFVIMLINKIMEEWKLILKFKMDLIAGLSLLRLGFLKIDPEAV
jgi:hypothetical protein